MDLDIRDVADLLNTSEGTIKKWLSEGKIPAYPIQGEYRFSRIEIEDWVIKHKNETSPFQDESDFEALEASEKASGTRGGNKQFSLYRAVHLGGVHDEVPGSSKEEVIQEVTGRLAHPLGIDDSGLANLLLERERLMPTALNNGIGVPHTRELLLNSRQDVVAVAFPKNPIPYGALDGEPVHSLFFLFASSDKRHLHLLAKIAHLSSQEESRNFLRTRPNKQELLAYIKEWESQIPQPA